MKLNKVLFLALCLTFFGSSLMAQVSPYELKAGNPTRKAILDVVRKPINAELGQKVEFVVGSAFARSNWAFVQGQMQQPSGKALDVNLFTDKDLKEEAKQGLFENNFQALLQKKNGKWVIVKRALGCTDVCWLDWANVKGVPHGIFPQ